MVGWFFLEFHTLVHGDLTKCFLFQLVLYVCFCYVIVNFQQSAVKF